MVQYILIIALLLVGSIDYYAQTCFQYTGEILEETDAGTVLLFETEGQVLVIDAYHYMKIEDKYYYQDSTQRFSNRNIHSLIQHFDCKWSFPELTSIDISWIAYSIYFEDSIITFVVTTIDEVLYASAIHNGRRYSLDLCPDSLRGYCSVDIWAHEEINYGVTKIIKDTVSIDTFSDITPEFETVSEVKLKKEAFTSIEIDSGEFNVVQENILFQELNVCTNLTAVYDTLSELIQVKPTTLKYRIIPADYETLTEQILDTSGYDLYTYRFTGELVDRVIDLSDTAVVIDTAVLDVNCTSEIWLDCINVELDTFYHHDTIVKAYRNMEACKFDENRFQLFCYSRDRIPARYRTRQYEKLTRDAEVETSELPAEYELIENIIRIKNENEIPDSCIQDSIITIDKTILIADEELLFSTKPAEYETITYQKLYKEINEDSLLSHLSNSLVFDSIEISTSPLNARILEDYLVFCPGLIAPQLIEKVLTVLREENLYLLDHYEEKEFIKALIKYELRYKLPISPLNYILLTQMNIR